jgi:hypothetical protein
MTTTDMKLYFAGSLIFIGFFLIFDSKDEPQDDNSNNQENVEIIKIDDKTEIRIVKGEKYRCTLQK